ncbi:MAG: metal ABC transporter permease [Spirochaetia bacterium]|nr:metal ABC transporter permease [Spirochaetia bacterium]
MAELFELFSMPFMQKAFLAGILTGYIASFYGVFVVQRGLSFLGSGLAHAAFGGVALGILLDLEPLYISIPFTILVATGITYVKQKSILGSDTAVGIFFSLSVALGIIFLSLKRTLTTDAFSYLFGSVLSVSNADLVIIGILTILSAATWPLWGRIAYASLDREMAKSEKVPVKKDDYIIAVILSVSIVVSIKLVGIILIASFLVIPAASARMISSTFRQMTLLSVFFGILGAFSGLILSYIADLPAGASIVLFQSGIFLVTMLFRKF